MFKKIITKINKKSESYGVFEWAQKVFFARKQSGLSPRRKFTTGFTLVETLVAISILMLSVTGPLYFASESLKAATYARDQITAFYLAQDAFEQIRKIRDDNIYGSGESAWNKGLTGCEISKCLVNADGNFYTVTLLSVGGDPSLYRNTNGIYSHKSSSDSIKTEFKRTVKITPNDTSGSDWTNSTEMKVTVNIDWNSRGVQRNFTAYEFLRKLN